ncbi:hypothetical protein PYW08_013138 [Mythimna loreyi]|uniref:Uncharacterized protein n=1 Tax=Mythimna loreyi TaxID=667449 RepID=A0ACC2QER2_9NEOP|nr:hypothetical protein PYW08_013138 [Mythimna loreyi]
MPPRKTPPPTPQEASKSDTNASSAPPTDTDNESSSVVTSRPRARKRQFDDEASSVMSEMKKSLDGFKSQQNSIQESINGIQKQNSEIVRSMEFIEKHYEDIKNKLIAMETERRTHLAYIQTLESKVESLERSQKQTCLEMKNVPVQKNETKDDLLKLVQKVGSATSTNVCVDQIRDVFRLNADKSGNRTVLVDFSSVILKEKILNSVKTYNRNNQNNKLNSTHLQLAGPPLPIYTSECLTHKAKKLFYQAREFGKINKFEFCWIAHGKVFLCRRAGAPSHRIDTDSDLDKLLSQPEA